MISVVRQFLQKSLHNKRKKEQHSTAFVVGTSNKIESRIVCSLGTKFGDPMALAAPEQKVISPPQSRRLVSDNQLGHACKRALNKSNTFENKAKLT